MGSIVETKLGKMDGAIDGTTLGVIVGTGVEAILGKIVGAIDGLTVGKHVGETVGE